MDHGLHRGLKAQRLASVCAFGVHKLLVLASEAQQSELHFVVGRQHVDEVVSERLWTVDVESAQGEALLPNTRVGFDGCHFVKLAGVAMDEMRTEEWKTEQAPVEAALAPLTRRRCRSVLWGMRKNPSGGLKSQIAVMHRLLRAGRKTARACRLKLALRARWSQTPWVTTRPSKRWPG